MKIWDTVKETFAILKGTFARFSEQQAFRHGAAISYYTVFSLPAIIIIIIRLIGRFFEENRVRDEIMAQLETFLGTDAAMQLGETIDQLTLSSGPWWATAIGVATLLFGATGTFYTLQNSLNEMWNIKVDVVGSGEIFKLIFDRLLSFTMVITMGFIMLVSMLLETFLALFKETISKIFAKSIMGVEEVVPVSTNLFDNLDIILLITYLIDFAFTISIITLVFILIFKFLPDASISWKEVWRGALLTAILFSIGQSLIGWYIGNSNVTSTYGAAGSVVVILLWVYYTAQILLLGAAYIFVRMERKGQSIEPSSISSKVAKNPITHIKNMLKGLKKREEKIEETKEKVEKKEEQIIEKEEKVLKKEEEVIKKEKKVVEKKKEVDKKEEELKGDKGDQDSNSLNTY